MAQCKFGTAVAVNANSGRSASRPPALCETTFCRRPCDGGLQPLRKCCLDTTGTANHIANHIAVWTPFGRGPPGTCSTQYKIVPENVAADRSANMGHTIMVAWPAVRVKTSSYECRKAPGCHFGIQGMLLSSINVVLLPCLVRPPSKSTVVTSAKCCVNFWAWGLNCLQCRATHLLLLLVWLWGTWQACLGPASVTAAQLHWGRWEASWMLGGRCFRSCEAGLSF